MEELDIDNMVGSSLVSRTSTTPGGSEVYIPLSYPNLIPYIGQKFNSLEVAYAFYKEYGRNCGFDVRKCAEKRHNDGTITYKQIVCNRAGKHEKNDDAKRKWMVSRCGCNAKIVLSFRGIDAYVVTLFVDSHNHEFANDDRRHFMKGNRNMDPSQIRICLHASAINVGSTRSHTLLKEISGGFVNVGATSTDFKNIKRDVKQYVGKNDAEMIIRKLTNLKNACDGFYFNYEKDDEDRLCKLFWADPISKRNFELFGDVCSVDATFRSNKYNMKFIPFTGIDNHKKLVTFAAALISKEDIESYCSVFQSFIDAMGREPIYIVSDQCPAMKQAIPSMFKAAKHRLCSWHIMKKFPTKIPPSFPNYGEILRRFNSLVYNSGLKPYEFEESWKAYIMKYNLSHIQWLSDIYENRQQWISAYHRDVFMGDLLRTTSISESANNFFNNYYVSGDTITEFYTRFESAMEYQRNVNSRLNHDDRVSKPPTATPLLIELDASKVYTRAVFYDVQEEIKKSIFDVLLESLSDVDGVKTFVVFSKSNELKKLEVKLNESNTEVECSCRLFIGRGIQCRHALYALNQRGVDKIPESYVLKRWKKNVEELTSGTLKNKVIEYRSLIEKDTDTLSRLWLDYQAIVNYSSFDKEKLEYVSSQIAELREKICVGDDLSKKKMKEAVIESIVGPQIEHEIGVKNPEVNSFKGCGSSKRIKSSIEQKAPPKGRTCSFCGEKSGHNKRSCPHLKHRDAAEDF